MIPTRSDYEEIFMGQGMTHAFTLRSNDPGRPKAMAPNRIVPSTGECLPIATPAPAKYLMAPAMGFNQVSSLFYRFMCLLNRRMLGCRYHKARYDDERLRAVAVVEGLPLNPHIHGVIKVPERLWVELSTIFPEDRDRSVSLGRLEAKDPWTRLVPGGTAKVRLLHNQRGWANYLTKESGLPDFSAKTLFYPR